MKNQLKLQAHLPAPPATTYRALTTATEVRAWLAEHADIDLPRDRFEFWGRHTPQGARGHHRLRHAEPGTRLAFTWTLDDQPTTVEIDLAPGPRGTTLTLTQSPLPTLEELMAPAGRRDGLHTMHTFWPMALANLNAHLRGRAPLPRCDFSGSRAPEIRIELTIDAPPHDVFGSLVDPHRIKQWFGWEPEIEPRLGGRMTFGADGKIFEFEPGRTLAYGDSEGTVVRWELRDSAGKTHLTFVQSGFAPDELDNAAQHEAGWLGGLANLVELHETGPGWQPPSTELPEDEE
ncbi:SRPBCC family protein [Amycolatopsis anabasis]|uniref:SRPBCC family protein n=1 Tax=Amycolatopsis anabasis TaxID=1840409 RepID=UPI00131CFB96|nr:SRPBCC domain-containing protein [Amycolatopsis anabasis]